MVRPLRKKTRQGVPYTRRPVVETAIADLERLDLTELVARCQLWPASITGFVSNEAILYFVRTTASSSRHHASLLRILMGRTLRLLPKPDKTNSMTTDMRLLAIRDRVMDALVDMLLSDQTTYEDKLDYFEVNFNGALKKDRMDASTQVQIELNRSTELMNEDEEVFAEVEQAIEHYDPFDPDELDKKNYRQLLERAIDTLPPLQKRIVEMWRLEIPIISSDPSVLTISRALGKAEKTIRNQRDRAFATLRRRLERKELLS